MLDKNNYGLSKFQLPSGPKDDSYKITLYVDIIDDSDGIMTFELVTKCIVKPNQQIINNYVNNLLSDTNKQELKNQLQTNGIKQTVSFITSLTSILENNQIDNTKTNITNSTNKDQSDKNTAIKQVLIEVVSNLPSNNINNIILISSTLSVLTNKPNELNDNSASLALNKAQELTDNLLELSAPLPLNIIHQTTSSIVNSITNCLISSIQINLSSNENIKNNNSYDFSVNTFTNTSTNSDQIIDLYKKSVNILNQVANMTLGKLSLNQDIQSKTSSMEMNFKKSKTSDFDTNIKSVEGEIKIPNLCQSLKLNDVECSTRVLMSQVLSNIYN